MVIKLTNLMRGTHLILKTNVNISNDNTIYFTYKKLTIKINIEEYCLITCRLYINTKTVK